MENFQIIFEDPQFAVLSKSAGVAIQSLEYTIHPEIEQHFQGKSILIVNRIDQPVSGIFILAFSDFAERDLRLQFENQIAKKTYVAICENDIGEKGRLDHLLLKVGNKSKVTNDSAGKPSSLSYQRFGKSDRYFGYFIQLHTGRFHQIRTQMAHAGACIKGDLKYGAKRSHPGGGICLHSYQLEVNHPQTQERLKFSATPPQDSLWDYFKTLLP